MCEHVSVGRYGSPGPVKDYELLHSVLIEPSDFRMHEDQLMYTFISHAERGGMSVLRDAASDEEFREALRLRLTKADRKFAGIASFPCSGVREIVASTDVDGRQAGDRLYCVLDTDVADRPHHADILVTVPRIGEITRGTFRRQRNRLMAAVGTDIVPPATFRGGAIGQR